MDNVEEVNILKCRVNLSKCRVGSSSSKTEICDKLEGKSENVGNTEGKKKKIKLSDGGLQSGNLKEIQENIGDDIETDRVLIKQQLAAVIKERDSLKKSKENADAKYDELTKKLREQVECPVCMEVPTSGPIHVCPNGHFVCSKCKQANCPTCRSKMLSGKSLLAVTVIENIEHKCKHDGCEELLTIQAFKMHLELCVHNPVHRIILCPASRETCGKQMELSKIYDHIMRECTGSWNAEKVEASLTNGKAWHAFTGPVSTLTSKGIALNCDGSHFYLSVTELPAFTVFSIQHFGDRFECEKFAVDIVVNRPDDTDLTGRYVHKITCVPLSVDFDHEVKKTDGLVIGSQQMEKIGKRDENTGVLRIAITLIIKKVQM